MVRGRVDAGTTYVGKLIVHPQCQGRGLGTRLLLAIEQHCATERYEIFTSTRSLHNLRLYERLGYKKFREKQITDELTFAYLEKFLSHTRPDARGFCKFLIDCEFAFDEKLSDTIEDSVAFPLNWKKDPTVSSMLVMLDAINEKFRGVENLWGKLKGGAISFYFLSIKDMGLNDEFYITMNSRGKLLTDFEHFKAEFKRRLDELDRELSDEIILKIDTDRTDLLWAYHDANNLVDDG